MPWVFVSVLLSGAGEGLAWESAREDVHQATKRFAIEGFNIRVDRCRIQLRRFHLRNQVCDGESFDLHMSDCSAAWENSAEAESESFVSRANAEVINCLGKIHISTTGEPNLLPDLDSLEDEH